ncbi:hypothetical protein [Brevibacillus dissolubilis]|uniref:hypothetical protein n=1 Tax=Brevibacillus dissolubilis TaxID=1844116 RepID=UPI001116B2EC|nr:hypothetical protein [Brevibacillus dissolubilis]
MDVRILNMYLWGLLSVLGPLGMRVEREHVRLLDSSYADDTVQILSEVTGEIDGEILIGMSEGSFMCLVESFQIPPEVVDADMRRSLLTEFGDMVKSHAITGYKSTGLNIEFKRVLLYDEVREEKAKQAHSLSVALRVNDQHPLYIHFVLGEHYRSAQLIS